MRQLQAIDELRECAMSKLREIAAEHGPSSRLYLGCCSLWEKNDEAAYLSLVQGDFDNAIAVLDHGLAALALGPMAAANEGLGDEDVLRLMAG
jgi:hypothetical protein